MNVQAPETCDLDCWCTDVTYIRDVRYKAMRWSPIDPGEEFPRFLPEEAA